METKLNSNKNEEILMVTNNAPCIFCCQKTPVNLAKAVQKFTRKIKKVCEALEISFSLIANLPKAPFCEECIKIVRDVAELKRRIDNLQVQLDLKTTTILKLLKNEYKINKENEERNYPKFLPSELREKLVKELKIIPSTKVLKRKIIVENNPRPKGFCNENRAVSFGRSEIKVNSDPDWAPNYDSEDNIELRCESSLNIIPPPTTTIAEPEITVVNIPEDFIIRDCFVRLEKLSPQQIAQKIIEYSPQTNSKRKRENPDNSEGQNRPKRITCSYVYPKTRRRCQRKFLEDAEMKIHYEKVHINHENESICPHCSRVFPSYYNLKLHLPMHRDQGDFTCDLCGENFRTDYLYTKHRVKIHNEPYPYICDICGQGFFRPVELKYHFYIHNGKWPFMCDECDYGTTSVAWLKRHKAYNHVRPDEPTVTCTECNKVFKSQLHYNRHITRHVEGRPIQCSLCSATFKLESDLKPHMIGVHVNERKFICELCGADFKTLKHLRNHIKGHPTRKVAFAKRNRQKANPTSSSSAGSATQSNPEPQTMNEEIPLANDPDYSMLLDVGISNIDFV